MHETAFEHSGLLHTLGGGNQVVLTICRRSEAQLFDFYSSLIAGGARFELPVSEAVRQAREQFPNTAPARWNLVISHQRRIRINREYNNQEAPAEATLLEVKGKAAVDVIFNELKAAYAEESEKPSLRRLAPLGIFGWLLDSSQSQLVQQWTEAALVDKVKPDPVIGAPPAKKTQG